MIEYLYLYILIGIAALLATHFWIQDYKETRPRHRAYRAKHSMWGVAPSYAMAVGRHRA